MRILGTLVALALPAALLATASGTPGQAATDQSDPRRNAPELTVQVVAGGLDHAWDVRPLGDGRLLVTQRDRRRLTLVETDGETRNVDLESRRRIWTSGETGLMGLAVDPRFAENHRVYTCQGWRKPGGGHDIRVIAWRLNDAATRASRTEVLIDGLPSVSGRHGGCRLLITNNGSLLVGTGDAAVGRNPQSLRSLGGKTLRLDRFTGRPWPTNPWARADGVKRYLWTYGHRNVQGLAQRGDGSLWSVEHGTWRDDEINKLRPRGNYGWNPVPGYNEAVPMTDFSLPGKQRGARWRSGQPTIATSGAAFVQGAGWGAYRGTLAVGCLGGERLMFVKFSDRGRLRWDRAPAVLRDRGRLRGVTLDLDGSLLVTTDNGGGNDVVLRVRPAT